MLLKTKDRVWRIGNEAGILLKTNVVTRKMQECYWKQKVLLETQSYRQQASGRVLSPYLMMDALYDKADRLDVFYDVAHLTPVLRNLRFQSHFTQVEHWMG